MNTQKGLKHGVYKLFWKEGGMSLASIGFTHDGTNWYAPCNWTSQFKGAPTVASTDWESIDRIELILENNYNRDESESPSPSSTKEPVRGSVEEAAERWALVGYAKAPEQSREDAEYIQSVAKHSYIAGSKHTTSIPEPHPGREQILLDALRNIKRNTLGIGLTAGDINQIATVALASYQSLLAGEQGESHND